MGFIVFVVINPRLLSANRVDFGYFGFISYPISPPPPGEHVDYSLYPVAPMAIDSDVILAVAHPNECAKGVKVLRGFFSRV